MEKQLSLKQEKVPAQNTPGSRPVPADGKSLIIAPDSKNVDYTMLLSQALQCVNTAEILSKVEVGTQYVVQIPAEFRQAYESGEMFVMENMKTGQKWPSLMEIAANGRKQVVTPLPIAEQAVVQGNPIQELANSQYNLLMQRQMTHLTNVVENAYRVVKDIQQGQMDDRIGLLEAGKNGLLLAMSMPEGDERMRQIDSSRQNLLVAQAQIAKSLERRATEFEALPKSASVRFIRELSHSGYLAEKSRNVQIMQDYYDLYLQATKLLAASYTVCGNNETAELTFRLSESMIQDIDFSKVKTIQYLHKGLKDMFYNDPTGYITAEQEISRENAKKFDYISFEVSGEKLLEALRNGEETV